MVQIGFGGDIIKATCKCHEGQFLVRVYASIPGSDPETLSTFEFPTEKEAEEKLDGLVKDTAYKFLRIVGLDPALATNVTVSHGDQAVRDELRMRNNSNPNLH